MKSDPQVVKLKFDKELKLFNDSRENYRKRGIIMTHVDYPNMYISFFKINLIPVPLIFTVRINFDDYDFVPLSVRFVDSFTLQPLADFKFPFLRKISDNSNPQNLIQKNKGKLPFLCIPGIREYHSHPAHTGDSWFLHRKKGGEGGLGFIIENLFTYGLSAVDGYSIPNIKTPVLSLNIESKNIPV